MRQTDKFEGHLKPILPRLFQFRPWVGQRSDGIGVAQVIIPPNAVRSTRSNLPQSGLGLELHRTYLDDEGRTCATRHAMTFSVVDLPLRSNHSILLLMWNQHYCPYTSFERFLLQWPRSFSYRPPTTLRFAIVFAKELRTETR